MNPSQTPQPDEKIVNGLLCRWLPGFGEYRPIGRRELSRRVVEAEAQIARSLLQEGNTDWRQAWREPVNDEVHPLPPRVYPRGGWLLKPGNGDHEADRYGNVPVNKS